VQTSSDSAQRRNKIWPVLLSWCKELQGARKNKNLTETLAPMSHSVFHTSVKKRSHGTCHNDPCLQHTCRGGMAWCRRNLSHGAVFTFPSTVLARGQGRGVGRWPAIAADYQPMPRHQL